MGLCPRGPGTSSPVPGPSCFLAKGPHVLHLLFSFPFSLPEPSYANRADGRAGLRGLPQAEPPTHAAECRRAGGWREREEQQQLGGPR